MKDCISSSPSMNRRFEILSVWSTTEDFLFFYSFVKTYAMQILQTAITRTVLAAQAERS